MVSSAGFSQLGFLSNVSLASGPQQGFLSMVSTARFPQQVFHSRESLRMIAWGLAWVVYTLCLCI